MVLRTLEQKIEALFEGVFGRAFRTNVQPIELARKLVKEMDDHRSISVSRVYVPNEYTVYLSPDDRTQFEGYEESLRNELRQYLAEHARRESYAVLTPPTVLFETDEDLAIGEFGIATRMAQPPTDEDAPAAEPGATMIYKPKTPIAQQTEAVSPEELGMEQELAVLTVAGERHEIDRRRVVLGRARDCDVRVADPNVSRRHAELRQEGAGYWIVDLDSTNGLEVNGTRTKREKLADGDRIKLGSTEALFSLERR